jgi:hypothetical protein
MYQPRAAAITPVALCRWPLEILRVVVVAAAGKPSVDRINHALHTIATLPTLFSPLLRVVGRVVGQSWRWCERALVEVSREGLVVAKSRYVG